MLFLVSNMPVDFPLQFHWILDRRLVIREAHVSPTAWGDFDSSRRFCFVIRRELRGWDERYVALVLGDLAPAEAAACDYGDDGEKGDAAYDAACDSSYIYAGAGLRTSGC
jgi:hypothetical protein